MEVAVPGMISRNKVAAEAYDVVTVLFAVLDLSYTPNAVVELLPHSHCVGANVTAP